MSVDTSSNKVIIFDTTLRDDDSHRVSINLDEKCRIAEALEEMGVDIVERSYRIERRLWDFISRENGKELDRVQPGQSGRGDIDRAAEALKPAARPRIHTFIATSPLHMKYKLQMEPDEVYQNVVDSVSHARNFTDDVDWSPEDGTRTEHDFLCRCVEAAINAGATCINLPAVDIQSGRIRRPDPDADRTGA